MSAHSVLVPRFHHLPFRPSLDISPGFALTNVVLGAPRTCVGNCSHHRPPVSYSALVPDKDLFAAEVVRDPFVGKGDDKVRVAVHLAAGAEGALLVVV